MENISGNALVIKEINANLVRKTLKTMGLSTKQQVAKATGLSLVTVGTVLNHLVKNNEVFESERSPSSGGRPAQQYLYNENFSHALILFPYEAMDSTFINSSVVNLSGQCLYKLNTKVEEVDLKVFEKIIEPLLIAYPSIRVIGFGHPGVEWNGKIIVSDYKNLIGASFIEHFHKLYHLPVVIENDVNAAVMGFAKREQAFGDCTLTYLYFPYQHPPGAGILINGKLFKGKSNFAGEISSVPSTAVWNEALYSSFDNTCTAIAELIVTICSILNPARVVLNGNFISKAHIEDIKLKCRKRLPENIVPDISKSEDFVSDYQSGLIARTLEQLEPDIKLTRRK